MTALPSLLVRDTRRVRTLSVLPIRSVRHSLDTDDSLIIRPAAQRGRLGRPL